MGNDKTKAYGFEPGAAQRLNPESRFTEELSPTLRADMGDNQVSVVAVDLYNQTIDGEVTATVTAACGGTNTSGPKVMSVGFSFGQSSLARSIGYQEECSPTLRGGEGGNQKPCVLDMRESSVTIPINTMVGTRMTEEKRTTLGIGKDGDPQFTLSSAHEHAVFHSEPILRESRVYGIDQQGGKGNASYTENVAPTILSDSHGTPHAVCYPEPILLESNQNNATVQTNGISTTLPASLGMGGGYVPMVVESRGDENRATDYTTLCCDVGWLQTYKDQGSTLLARQYKDPPIVTAREPGAVFRKDCGTMEERHSVVRRLTPLECERLQGFPDGWTDIGEWTDSKGKVHKEADTPRYKALGNSIAVGYANNQSGFWCWLAKRLCAQYDRPVTMASLFDGIGGFPLAFEAAGAKAVWASEIEEFPIAVTKIRFPEEDEDV